MDDDLDSPMTIKTSLRPGTLHRTDLIIVIRFYAPKVEIDVSFELERLRD